MTDERPLDPARRDAEDAARVHAAAEAWRRRSRLVRFLRKALPIGIGVVLVALLGWVAVRSVISRVQDVRAESAAVRMTNPRFYGQDSQGRSFILGAKEAVRQTGRNEGIRLIEPLLRLNNASNRPTELRAKSGVYDETRDVVALRGNVRITDAGSGFAFQTNETVIDTDKGIVSGNSPVTGRGPLGEISASSYAIHEEGARMVFKGGVRARIQQSR